MYRKWAIWSGSWNCYRRHRNVNLLETEYEENNTFVNWRRGSIVSWAQNQINFWFIRSIHKNRRRGTINVLNIKDLTDFSLFLRMIAALRIWKAELIASKLLAPGAASMVCSCSINTRWFKSWYQSIPLEKMKQRDYRIPLLDVDLSLQLMILS